MSGPSVGAAGTGEDVGADQGSPPSSNDDDSGNGDDPGDGVVSEAHPLRGESLFTRGHAQSDDDSATTCVPDGLVEERDLHPRSGGCCTR